MAVASPYPNRFRIASVLAAILAMCPLVAWANSPPGVTATHAVTNSWNTGFNGEVTVRNNGATVLSGWTVSFDFPGTITNLWNGVILSHTGNQYIVKDAGYNKDIAVGGSTAFGFTADPALTTSPPVNFLINCSSAVSIADASTTEGDSGTKTMTFTVSRTGTVTSAMTVNAATAPGTAQAGSDFVALSQTLSFAANETSKTVSVTINGDTVEEPNETFTVTLSNATGSTTISRATATGTILNDDIVSHLTIADVSAYEGDTGTAAVEFVLKLAPPAPQALSVQVATVADSALAGSDFVALSQTVNFAQGESQKSVMVAIVGDTAIEPKEQFSLTANAPGAGLTIDDGTAVCAIYDNDDPDAATVVINEFCAAPSQRALRWSADGTPQLGMGTPWHRSGYADPWWSAGALPIGYGYATLGTNVGGVMAGRTPSLYLRKEFTATAAQAGSDGVLKLQIEYDDGFIAFLNGVEIARANMGPPKHFAYAAQPAYNNRPSAAMVEISLGAASTRLLTGTNLLCIQGHNAVTDPAANNFASTATFRINAGLRMDAGGSVPAATLVGYGAAGGNWKYFVGLAEPSGGVFDPVLLSGNFAPPQGQEEDFEDTDSFSDWVELKNNTAAPKDVSGWSLTDDPTAPAKWHFPAGTVIAPGGFLLVHCDDREESNGFTALTPRSLIVAGATWRHLSTGADPGATWKTVAFNDSAWPSGPAPLGYSPANEDGAATIIAGGTNTHLTDYFRAEFTVTNPAAFVGTLSLRFQRDDGVVIHLNGVEVKRDNMPDGDISATTPAASNVADEGAWITATIPASGLVAGKNVVAVELHQNSTASSDARFNLDLTGYEQVAGAATAQLHAGFSLDGAGEYLGLSDANGTLRDEILTWPQQQPFLAYARSSANPELWGFSEATPGSANAAAPLPDRVDAPEFVQADAAVPGGFSPLASGFYNTAKSLVLRTATPGAVIRYTTDGSEPLESGNGATYSAPIPLTAPNDKTAVILRAKAFKAGLLASKDVSRTYLMNQNTGLRAMPVLSLVADAGRCFFAPMGVMAISGGSYDADTLWQPGTVDSYNIPQHHGATTEREISAELIYPDGRPGFRDDVGLRVAGSPYGRPRYKFQQTSLSPWTIWEPKEKGSFNLVWRDDYGAKDLDFEIFPGWPVKTFTQLRLRAGSNDNFNPFISDEFMRRMLGEMGHDALRGDFVMLYLNGSFKGMYNVCERLRNDTFQRHFRTDNDFDVKYVNEYRAGDATAWNAFRSAYNRDLTVAANYTAVAGMTDLVNIADYYLLNIYANTWDWATWQAGANNYVLYRERIPAAKWRFTVWDGEGTFNNQSYFGQGPSFNVITQHLSGSDDTNELATIYKRLVGVPPFTGADSKGNAEFRLLVADRIHRHFFNGGILDDRTTTNRIFQLKNQLKALVQTGVAYLNGTFREDWWDTWINASTGRRANLFGPAATQLAAAGLWPATTPPVFSPHGGNVAAGYSLTMSGTPAGGTLFYTLDGSDPRLAGGTAAPAALTYTAAVALNRVTTVKARIRSSTGEWSALTEAVFLVPSVPPAAANLVISEFMYHPPHTSAADEALGFTDRDDFEFIRLTNISGTPIDLANLRFTAGVTFDFSTGAFTALNPGTSALVVKRRDAFLQRYGAALAASIAGEFAGNLSNGGETLTLAILSGPTLTTLHTLTYSDDLPWPLAGDTGSSLLLINPNSAPDHSLAENWTAHPHPGGQPGGTLANLSFAQWKSLAFNAADAANAAVSGPLADPDGDGQPNLVEFALGGHPDRRDAPPLETFLTQLAGDRFFTLKFRTVPTATGITITLQVATALTAWQTGPAVLTPIGAPTPQPDGTLEHTYRLTSPISTAPGTQFVRLKVE
jgi:hypothetical protein